jgi:hypothetical protein
MRNGPLAIVNMCSFLLQQAYMSIALTLRFVEVLHPHWTQVH